MGLRSLSSLFLGFGWLMEWLGWDGGQKGIRLGLC